MGRRRRHRFRKGSEQYTCCFGKNKSQKLVMSGLAVSIYELKVSAKLLSLSYPKRLSVSTSTRLQTPHSSATMLWNLWARSSDNVLSSWQYQLSNFLQLFVLLGKKNEGNRTIAILHTTYRFSMCLVSAMGCQVCRSVGLMRSKVA